MLDSIRGVKSWYAISNHCEARRPPKKATKDAAMERVTIIHSLFWAFYPIFYLLVCCQLAPVGPECTVPLLYTSCIFRAKGSFLRGMVATDAQTTRSLIFSAQSACVGAFDGSPSFRLCAT